MKLRKWKLIFRVLFNPRCKEYGYKFNDHLANLIEYGIDNHADKRGKGASDALLYDLSYGKDVLK